MKSSQNYVFDESHTILFSTESHGIMIYSLSNYLIMLLEVKLINDSNYTFMLNHNFDLIARLLYANQAQGRRKNIRALCTKACTFSCNLNNQAHSGVLQDISLSHFSFVFPEGRLNVQMYEKVSDFHFNIRGFMFRSDAVLIMQRPVNGEELYVFAFVSSTGANGLDQRIKQLLVPNIYQLMNANCKNLLEQIYNKFSIEGLNAEVEEISDIDDDRI